MSKQTGLIRLDGTIGGISFYRAEGEDLAKTANGPSKEKIATDPAFIRTRENNAEFGGSATAAKSLRLALATALQTMGDPRLPSRLTKLYKEINAKGTGIRGERPISVSENRPMLNNLEFNIRAAFSSVFNAPYTFSSNASRTQGTIDIPAFSPASFVHAPKGATHFRLTAIIGVVSDFVYNSDTAKYDPTDPTLDMLSALTYGATIELNVATVAAINLVAALDPAPTMTGTVSVVHCIGIEFFQEVSGAFYLLSQDNCMKSIEVF